MLNGKNYFYFPNASTWVYHIIKNTHYVSQSGTYDTYIILKLMMHFAELLNKIVVIQIEEKLIFEIYNDDVNNI